MNELQLWFTCLMVGGRRLTIPQIKTFTTLFGEVLHKRMHKLVTEVLGPGRVRDVICTHESMTSPLIYTEWAYGIKTAGAKTTPPLPSIVNTIIVAAFIEWVTNGPKARQARTVLCGMVYDHVFPPKRKNHHYPDLF